MNLFLTEIRRFWGRRITWGVIIITSLLMTLAAVIVFSQSSSEEGAGRAAAEAEAARQSDFCVSDISAQVAAGSTNFDPELIPPSESMSDEEFADFLRSEYCYQDPAWYGDGDKRFWATSILGGETEDWSATRPDGQPASYRAGGEQVREARFGLEGVIPGVSIFFLVLAIVIGASFVGAEYKFGTVENLLLWEPRRSRVLLTKFAAGFSSSFVLTAAVLGLLSALLFAVAALRGTTTGVDSRFWIDLFSVLARAGIAGGLFFIIAMSVAVIARNTTASVGVLLGWFVISNIVIQLVARWFRRWELFTNATAFITESDAIASRTIGGQTLDVYGHGYLTAGIVVAVWAALLAAIATVVFVRRDID